MASSCTSMFKSNLAFGPCRVACYGTDSQAGTWSQGREDGQLSQVVEALHGLVERGSHVDNSVFYGVLKDCITLRNLVLGTRVHTLAVKSGYESDGFLANHLIRMYATHGRLEEAGRVFSKVPAPNRYVWASIILAHARCGQPVLAIELYEKMRESAVRPDNHVFVAVLKACATAKDLHAGRQVHGDIRGTEVNQLVGNCLVDMYAKCGSLDDAQKVFDHMPSKDVVTWNVIIGGYAQHGLGYEALALYERMQCEGTIRADAVTFVCTLQACVRVRALPQGKQLHLQIRESGLDADVVVGNSLVNMYAKCGSLEDARALFDNLPTRDVVTWNAMIAGYVQHGLGQEALTLYGGMQREGITPADAVTFVCLLQACTRAGALHQGKQLHAQILNRELEADLVIGNSLVSMYAKCGCLQDARRVFDRLPTRDVVTWNVIFAGYVQYGLGEEALSLYDSMQQEGITQADSITFLCLLQACGSVAGLEKGKGIHSQISKSGLEDTDVSLANAVIDMYSKCDCLEDAWRVFSRLSVRDVVTWTTMILGYAEQGLGDEALMLYETMQKECVSPANAVTYVCLLQAFASIGALHQGKQLHTKIQEQGLEADVVVGTCLVDMFAKCGSLQDAYRVFLELPNKNVVTWTAMIAGYAQHGLGQEALRLYQSMQQEGISSANAVTFACLLEACASLKALDEGKNLHAQIQERGLDADVVLGTCLVDMYAKCGSLEDAHRVFDNMLCKNVMTWNALISGYTQHGLGEEALAVHSSMQQEGITPANAVTFVCLLQACGSVPVLDQGQHLCELIKDRGLESDVVVGACMVDMYAKCGSLDQARTVFDTLPSKTVVTWTAMIAGYVLHGLSQEALDLYANMQQEGITAANAVTFVALLQACGSVAGLEKGKEIHAQILTLGLDAKDLFLANALIDMYGKCGSMADAQQVFNATSGRDVVTWSALIAGYARQGLSDLVFQLFHVARQDGIQPDGVTFLSLLTVCSHAGLVDKGLEYFGAMCREYGIRPTIEHYTCIVDLLARAGQMNQAMQMVKTMPCQPNGVLWRCVLGACQKWADVELGTHAFECAVRLDKNDAAAYVLMSNIYAAAQMQEKAKGIQAMRLKTGAWKVPGQSCLTAMSGAVHTFSVDDIAHTECHLLDAKLKDVHLKLKEEEYVLSCPTLSTCGMLRQKLTLDLSCPNRQ